MTSDGDRVLRDRKLPVPEGANNRGRRFGRCSNGRAEERPGRQGAGRQQLSARVPYFLDPARTAGTVDSGRSSTVLLTYHKIGSKAVLAIALFLNTGQRRSDVIRFAASMSARKADVQRSQGRNRKPKRLTLPVLPTLQAITMRRHAGHELSRNRAGSRLHGRRIRNWFRDRCIEAACPAALTD